MGDPVVVESWHLPRALSDEALRLLTTLPMEEIERRLRGPAPAADGEVADPALRPIPVSERLPGPDDCQPWPGNPDKTHWCWAFSKGTLDDDWWEMRSVTSLTTYKCMHTHWLPAHALPLPEVE